MQIIEEDSHGASRRRFTKGADHDESSHRWYATGRGSLMETILVIGSNADIVDLIATVLRDNGYSIVKSTSEAALPDQEMPALIICYVNPVDHARSFTKAIRKKKGWRRIPVILVSSDPAIIGEGQGLEVIGIQLRHWDFDRELIPHVRCHCPTRNRQDSQP